MLGNRYYLVTILTCTFLFKLFLLFYLLTRSISASKKSQRSIYLLIGVLIGASIADSAWIIKLISMLFIPTLNPLLWICISWAFPVMQYQSLALFIESLVAPQYKFNVRRLTFLTISSLFFIFFLYEGFATWYTGLWSNIMQRGQEICVIYCLFF